MCEVECSYNGFSRDYDEEIESIVGRESDGSGYGAGQRDLCWHFKSLEKAIEVMIKLKRAKRIKITRISICWERA